MKETNLKKYGNVCSVQNKEIQEKIKKNNIEKYGHEELFKSDIIKEQIKKTNIEKYGSINPFQSEKIKEKIKETNIKKYGVEYPIQNNEIKKKIDNANILKYGCINPFQSEKIKEKIKETNMKKYGVEYPMQLSEIYEKNSKNAYKLKKYTFPSGKQINIQGYENFALNEIIKNISEDNIITGCTNVPKINYIGIDGKNHVHYVDIFIPSQKRCIEVKSTWTAKKKEDNIFLKQEAGKKLGYEYEIWIYDDKGNKVECYK
jgi:hypothetical protein